MIYVIIAVVVVISALARSAMRNGGDEPLWFVGNIFMLWALSAAVFGYPGLIIPALLLVPVIFTALILITQGR